ncbi:MAG: isomerase [Proteobacteria bacterium]|nr:isomerase [Pseudomonadota bacterium]
MERLQRIMIGNGLLVVLVSMLSGYMLMFNLLGGFEVWPGKIIAIPSYGTSDGWVRAHTGGALNGALVIIVGLAMPKLNLSAAMQKFTTWGFIYVAWSFTIFYWLGNASSNRALTLGPSPLGEPDMIGLIGFLPAAPSIVLVLVLLVVAAKGVFSSSDD